MRLSSSLRATSDAGEPRGHHLIDSHMHPWGLDEEDINGSTGGCDQDSTAGDQPCFEDSITVTAPRSDLPSLACQGGGCGVLVDGAAVPTERGLLSRFEAAGLFTRQWRREFVAGRYWGTGFGEEALEQYATTLTDPTASVLSKTVSAAGGFFAALWTPKTYLKTYTVLLGGAGAGRWMAVHQPEVTALSKGNVLKILSRPQQWGFRIDPAHRGKPWGHIHFWRW